MMCFLISKIFLILDFSADTSKHDEESNNVNNIPPQTPSSGILKNNFESKKQSNTVKFNPRNDIRLIEGQKQEQGKRKISGNIKQQSKNILRNINKEKNVRRSIESESEGYHSDCSSPRVRERRVSSSRKISSNNQRKSSNRKSSSSSSSRNSTSHSSDKSDAQNVGDAAVSKHDDTHKDSGKNIWR